MSNNTTLPATGTVVATEEINGVHYQILKIAHGPEGTATPASDATPMPTAVQDVSLLERVALKALARLTFSTAGARVDCGGSAVTASIAASQTLANVTALGSANNVSIGRSTPDGASILMSQLSYTNGFRARLV